MKKILLLITIIFVFSCSDEYKMKQDFKKSFKETMHNPSSFELVSFDIIKDAYSYSEKNRKFIDSTYEVNQNYLNYRRISDSLYEIEEQRDENFRFTEILVSVRGENAYGALRINEHIVLYYFDNKIRSIDGNMIY